MRFQLVLIFTGFTSSTKIEVRLPNFGGQIIKFLVASQICWTSSVYAMNVDNKCKAMYFGAGCFWHVQHELVDTEKKFLSRDDQHITSTAGYAGSLKFPTDGTVCYHNLQREGDYGELGYSEAVQVNLPESSFQIVAENYFSLLKNGDRPDKGDIGAEYRCLIGIPGGVKSRLYPLLEQEAAKRKIVLKEGLGQDADTLGKKIVWVMDTEKFPFRPAEVYHQFHDGFMPGEEYGRAYHDLRKIALDRGYIRPTGCPEKLLL